jgi:glycosyltransferase 2 family protein
MAGTSAPRPAQPAAHRDLEPLLRLSGRAILLVVALVASVYALLPQLTDLRGAAEQVRDARWTWAVLAVLVVPGVFAGAALSISGAAPVRLRIGPTYLTEVASAFSTKLAPSTVGGMSLNIRYLQRQGADRGTATASVGLNAMSGSVVHTVLLVATAVLAGRSAFGRLRLPKPEALAIGGAVVALLTLAVLLVPSVRRIMVGKVGPTLRRSAEGLHAVLRRPGHVARLVGGNLLVILFLLGCFVLSARAFNADAHLVTLAAVYLAGSAVAIISPTPGGLGAVEAALVASLVAAGTPDTVAVPAVFLFRLVTFWLPIVPGWFCLVWLRHHDDV